MGKKSAERRKQGLVRNSFFIVFYFRYGTIHRNL